jgi:hypothetical protein
VKPNPSLNVTIFVNRSAALMIGAAFFMIRKTPEGEYRSGQGWIIDEIVKAGFGSFAFPTSKHNAQVLRGKLLKSD